MHHLFLSIIPNGFSEEDIDLSESEDEMSKVRHALQHELPINKESSSSEESELEKIKQKCPSSKKKKKIHWKKKYFVVPAANFTSNLRSLLET